MKKFDGRMEWKNSQVTRKTETKKTETKKTETKKTLRLTFRFF
jgi:hypothetical protein